MIPPARDLRTEAGLRRIRRYLHAHPETSGHERRTAESISRWLRQTAATDLLVGVGGHGVVARLPGRGEGPAVGLRAELDALPIPEATDLGPHASQVPNCSHKCGHDGHMTILLGLAHRLTQKPPAGDLYLFFQPSEETGQGAAALLADERVRALPLDAVLAIHNLPGVARGTVVLRAGPFAAGSVGLILDLVGRTAHAGEPERGRSPAGAMASIMHWLEALPQHATPFASATRATVIHARLGSPAFGTTPGLAVVMATLRAERETTLRALQEHCRMHLPDIAAGYGLDFRLRWREPFPATHNEPRVVTAARAAANDLSLPLQELAGPMPWSEDFGHFTRHWPGALIGLGAGRRCPPLHAPSYDFPDSLLRPGVELLAAAVKRLQQAPNEPTESHA